MSLSKIEKHMIAELYLKSEAPGISEFYDLYDCFPFICKLYHDKPNLNITHFFQNPFSVYDAEIEILQKKGCYAKYGALAICIMFNNRLQDRFLTLVRHVD